MANTDDKPVTFMQPDKGSKRATEGAGVTLADPRTRKSFIRLAEDTGKLHKTVTEITKASGEEYGDVLSGVMAVIDAARERDQLNESEHDPDRLALADRVQARSLRERISMSEALEKEMGE